MAGGHGSEDHVYHPKDTIGETAYSGLYMGGLGALFSGMQASLTRRNIGAFGAITQYGGTTGIFAASGASYMFVRDMAANLREKDDYVASAFGGAACGAVLGAARGTMPGFVGFTVASAFALGLFTYSGGNLEGRVDDPDADLFARAEKARRTYRVPVEQTIAELGEGRGIYGPGYDERRRKRIKENYGIDVPP